jgi:hypothetical protein
MKFSSKFFLLAFALFAPEVLAATEQYPNISGNVLFQVQADRVLSTNKSGVSPNSAFLYVEPNFALNVNNNWAVKTDWRLQPNNVLTTRNSTYPERYRTFLQSDRSVGSNNEGLLVEELKVEFHNEDLKVSAGKFDPTFGTAYNKAKRIGIFTSQFTEDYNLREKIGASLTAFLENSKITVNSFFNDTTGLSSSAFNNRGRAPRNDGVAGNTGTLSSYSISMDGSNLGGVEDWFYNVGYRSLGVDNIPNRAREQGYVFGSEYLYKMTEVTSVIPFLEVTKINNFTGLQGRDALYTTAAVIGKYSSWTASVSHLTRNTSRAFSTPKVADRQLQMSVGYKFTNNLTLDATRAQVKEGSSKGALLGFAMSYLYQF